MKGNMKSSSIHSSWSKAETDRVVVIRAIEEMAEAGYAVLDRKADSLPLLILISGEIFVLGEDWVTRVF
jgi:hypothetical protein